MRGLDRNVIYSSNAPRCVGFLTTDFAPLYEQAIGDLVKWIRDGQIRYREDMLDGIESAPGSIEKLYSGANSGKLIIRL